MTNRCKGHSLFRDERHLIFAVKCTLRLSLNDLFIHLAVCLAVKSKNIFI